MTALNDTSEREIVQERVFDAPRELVFDCWTHPAHVARWFGPKGFRTTTEAMDFRVGGAWTFTMHGPDGTDYPNHIVYTRIERPSVIDYDHGNGKAVLFHTTVTFEDVGGKTRIEMRSVFPTKAAADGVKGYAIQGGRETLDKLGQLLEELQK